MTAPLAILPDTSDPWVERYADGWLLVEGELEFTRPSETTLRPSLAKVLGWNAGLAGGAKFVLSADGRVCLRAELPRTEAEASPEAVAAVAAGFDQAHRLWHLGAIDAAPEPLPPASPLPHLLQAGAESGWELRARPEGAVFADLEAAQGPWQAQFLPLPSGGILAVAELAALATASAEAGEAVALLLLLAGGALRWARPAVRTIDGRPAAAFEVVLPPAPAPEAIAEALSALSVACRLVGAETRALLDEATARTYLRVTGPKFRSSH